MEIREQSMPKYMERSFSDQNSNQSEVESLRSVIQNLRDIITKKNAEIDRLQRRLAEENIAKYKSP